MTPHVSDRLESLAIHLEVATLEESALFSYLAAALEECGVTVHATSLDALVEQAHLAATQVLQERIARPKNRRRIKLRGKSEAPSETRPGWKKVFGVLRRIGKPIVKAGGWGIGRALQGIGHVAKELGKGLGDKAAQMKWQ